MAPHDDKYLDFSAAYMLGALDGPELREFEAHLKTGCAVCAGEIAALSPVAALLPAALPEIPPPPELKERILFGARLSQVARQHYEEQPAAEAPALPQAPEVKIRRRWLAPSLAFALVVLVAAFTLYVRTLFTTIEEQRGLIGTQENNIVALKTELEQKEAILKVLESRRIDVFTMDGLTVNPVGYGKIIWDPDRKMAILQVSHLPPVPEGKDYQLWVIRAQKPVSAGVFAVTAGTESYFKVQSLDVSNRAEVNAFAVTLEPKGGMPQPTGEMYLMGKTAK